MSVAGLRPGLGRGGTIHSLLVSVMGGEVASGEETAEGGSGFMHNEGGRWPLVLGRLGAGGDPGPVDIVLRFGVAN